MSPSVCHSLCDGRNRRRRSTRQDPPLGEKMEISQTDRKKARAFLETIADVADRRYYLFCFDGGVLLPETVLKVMKKFQTGELKQKVVGEHDNEQPSNFDSVKESRRLTSLDRIPSRLCSPKAHVKETERNPDRSGQAPQRAEGV